MVRIESPPTESTSRRYRLLMELGEGGTAKVYLAVARGPGGFNKLVVLKGLKRQLATDVELRKSFLHEARLSARLNHPNVVQVNEVTELEGIPVIVMEYLEGRPLSDIINRAGGELTLPMVLRILSDALAGLHYSHELCDYDGTLLNVVHRDVTPQNVFVTFDGVVKVLDFGIARVGAGQGDTEHGVIKGKLRYMPPEQLVGDPVDRRSDLFAAGVMLWEAGARERMWKDLPEAAIMNRVINGEIPSPRSVNSACPEELERICMRALAYEKDDRYPTAAALQSDVDALSAKLTPRVQNAELGRKLAVWFADFRNETRQVIESKLREDTSLSLTGLQTSSLSPPESREPARVQRRQTLAVYVALASLVALVVVAGLWWRSWSPVPAPPIAVASSVEAPAVRSVSVRVTAFPSTAVIRIDGQPVASNPYADELPVDDGWHEIVAEAPGYRTLTRRTRLTRDIDLVVSLEPKPVVVASASASASVAAPAPVAPRGRAPRARPKAPAVDCSTPYYIDSRGVKKIRPDCL